MTNEGIPITKVDSDAHEASDNVEAGEWGVFVSRAVQGIRREFGEQAANRVATLLHDRKAEAIDATREHLVVTQAMLERTLGEVAEARRSHERLQADLARMEAWVRNAKMEAARIRSEAADFVTRRKAELNVAAGVEAVALADAWDAVRNQESEVAQ
jgi:hypothetical protein